MLLLLLLFILLRRSTCFADVEAPSRRWVEIGSQVSTVTASWFGWIAAGESTADRMIVELFLWTEKAGRPAGVLGRTHTMHAAARALEQRKACRPNEFRFGGAGTCTVRRARGAQTQSSHAAGGSRRHGRHVAYKGKGLVGGKPGCRRGDDGWNCMLKRLSGSRGGTMTRAPGPGSSIQPGA